MAEQALRSSGSEVFDLLRASPASNTSVNTIPVMTQPPPPGIERYAREGVPLDVTTGVQSLAKRAGLSWATTPEQRVQYMSQAYGGSKVDTTEDGQLIIRNVQGPDGKPKDLLVDEQGISVGDLMDLTKAGVQTGTDIAMFALLPGVAKAPNWATRILGGSALAAGVNEGEDALAKSLLNMQQTLGEHIKEAGKSFALGSAMAGTVEGALGLAGAATGQLKGEFAPGAAERAGVTAIGALERDTGYKILPSIGQVAQDPTVINLETYLSKLPFFGKKLLEQKRIREETARNIQRDLTADAQPLADLGADIAQGIKSQVEAPAQAANTLEKSLVNRAADQLETAIQGLAPEARNLTTEGTAALTKGAAQSDYNMFRGMRDTLFGEAGNPDIPLKGLKGRLAEIEKKLPSQELPAEAAPLSAILDEFGDQVKAAILDASGKPLATEAGKTINRDLVPPSLLKLVRGLRNLGDSIPLDQLRTVRNSIDNAIKEGRGLEGIDTFQLKQISHALTQTFEEGVAAIPDKIAATALTRANNFYKENINRFEEPIVARLLKSDATQPGFFRDFELMGQLQTNPDAYRAVEKFLKSTITEGGQPLVASAEPVLRKLNRAIMENVLSKARASADFGDLINARAFESELATIAPEVRASMLGASEDVISRNLNLLKQIKQGYESIPQSELERFMRFPANSQEELSKLVVAARKMRENADNTIIKPFLRGEQVDPSLLAKEGAFDALYHAKSNGEVAQVMAMLADNQPVRESISRNTAAQLFQEVAQELKPAEAALLKDASYLVDPVKLIAKFKNPQSRERLRTLLGDTSFNILENFAQAQAVLGKGGTSTLLGTSTATSIMTNALRFFRDVPHASKYLIYATALTNETLQRAVMEASANPNTSPARFAAALISSTPMLEALGQQYGESGAKYLVSGILKGIEAMSGPLRKFEPAQPQEATPTPATSQPARRTDGASVFDSLQLK